MLHCAIYVISATNVQGQYSEWIGELKQHMSLNIKMYQLLIVFKKPKT